MDEHRWRIWLNERMRGNGWIGNKMGTFAPHVAQSLRDFAAGKRNLDAAMAKLLSSFRFLDSHQPKVSESGYPICPHCGLELDTTLEELKEQVRERCRETNMPLAGPFIFKCVGCRQSIELGNL